MRISINKDRFCLIYYIVLLVILTLLTKPGVSYKETARLGFLILVVTPLIFNARFVPFVIVCFYGICKNVFYSLLPDNLTYSIILTLGLIAIHIKKLRFSGRDLIIPLSFLLYCIIISLLHSDTKESFITFGTLSLLLCPFIKNKKDIMMLALGLCLMATVLSLLYFINFDKYSFETGDDEFERGTWKNINFMSGAIGVGLPLSIALLLNIIEGEKPKWLRHLLVGNSILIIMALVTLSSRGTIISVTVSTLAIVFLSEIKRKYKIISLVVAVVLVTSLFVMGTMDLFIYRMTQEDTTGTYGGRSNIWAEKLGSFFNDDAMTQIFGMGRENCNNCSGVLKSTHNDFITALVGFGFFGLALFLSFVFYPVVSATLRYSLTIVAFTSFFLLECMVLEPFFRGHFPIWMYYIYTLKYAQIYRHAPSKKVMIELNSISEAGRKKETRITKNDNIT